MNFHTCSVTDKHSWAGQDGLCRRCRGVTTANQILGRDYLPRDEEYADFVQDTPDPQDQTLEELIQNVGGHAAFVESVRRIADHKRNGGAGNDVAGRKTRQLLNLIMRVPQPGQAGLLQQYRQFVAGFGIRLNQDNGVLYHDYSHFQADRPWQANLAHKRVRRDAFVETVRLSRTILMSWVSSDGVESGTASLGPNTPETRLKAAEYQAAARKKGFHTRFTLVQG